jgi:Zinc dependent phospholipase C
MAVQNDEPGYLAMDLARPPILGPLLRRLLTSLRTRIFFTKIVLTAILAVLPTAMIPAAHAYSVLTHEQVIDLLWKDHIVPMLRQRFPDATPQELDAAHAYAYGGSVLQDMGYYPFGSKFFSDLTHYVRTGDFVSNLIHESQDLNEYAFALGALAHYVSDNSGHPTINRAVPIEFPKLERKFGHTVTYEDDPKTHIRTEFGFDMVQVAKNRYTSDRYHDFIGFEISKPLLDRVFLKTYGIKTTDIMGDEDLAIGTFRRAVSKVIPEMTRVALLARKKEMVKEDPSFNKKEFLYYLSRTNYEKQWGKGYRRPGPGARILAFFLSIVPKVGPFSALGFKIPSTQTEDMYIKSVDLTVKDFRSALQQAESPDPRFENRDCDTGKETSLGEYARSDETYAKLLDRLADHNFAQVSPELRSNILGYFSGPKTLPAKDTKAAAKTEKELQQLRSYSPGSISANTPQP